MNSDLRVLREFGESRTPPSDQPPAQLRRRVLAGALPDRGGRIRLPHRLVGTRPAWRLGAIGATAAAVTAAMLVGQPGHLAGTAPPPAQAGATPEAVRILQLAAHQVTATPAPAARPDQFVFVESVNSEVSINIEPAKDPNGPHRATAELESRLSRRWNSVDGTHDDVARYLRWGSSRRPLEQPDVPSGCRDGKQTDPALPGVTRACTPQPAVRADLPTDAEAMLRYLYRPGGAPNVPADEKAFQRAGDVIEASLTAPAVQAAVFRAVAQIPGVTVSRGVVDAAGRHGIAVIRTDGPFRFELIFDAKAHRYLGSNAGLADLTTIAPGLTVSGMKSSDPTTQTAILRVAIVDKAGQLP
jgi:hypothetical protein